MRLSHPLAIWWALGLIAILPACSSTPDNTKPKALAAIDKPIPVVEIWRRGLGDGENYVFHPAVSGTTIFAAATDGGVVRFDDGKETWKVNPGPVLSGGVVANDQMVVVGALKGEVLALAPDNGRVLWRSQLGAEIVAPAAFLDDLIVVRTGDNRLYGLDAKDGQRKWSYQRSIPALSIRVTSPPVVADRLVFAGFPGGKLVAINTQNGQVVWEGTVALPKGATELERIADVVASPVMGAKEVCAVAHQGRLACFDLTTGNLLWARDISSTVNLALDHKAIYVSDDQGIIQAFDRVTGSTIWKQEKLANRRLSGPFLNRGYVVVADDQAQLHVLSRDDGAFRGRFSLEAGRVQSELRSYDTGFVLQTQSGLLVAMQIDQ